MHQVAPGYTVASTLIFYRQLAPMQGSWRRQPNRENQQIQ
jgi:hypothetical protein